MDEKNDDFFCEIFGKNVFSLTFLGCQNLFLGFGSIIWSGVRKFWCLGFFFFGENEKNSFFFFFVCFRGFFLYHTTRHRPIKGVQSCGPIRILEKIIFPKKIAFLQFFVHIRKKNNIGQFPIGKKAEGTCFWPSGMRFRLF